MTIKEIDKLKDLDFEKQVAFAYLTCERLYLNYVYFSQNYDFGNPKILREAIDCIYDNLFEQNPDENKIQSIIQKVEENTPDADDYSVIFVSSALDACTSILDSLDFLIDRDFSKIQSISTYGTDTIDMYIQEVENLDFNTDKDFQNKINNHPLMKREVAIQTGIISFLSNKTLDYGDVQTLLHLQENNKKGSLNL
jgi:uncharacterized protein YjaG (DUF416 family)